MCSTIAALLSVGLWCSASAAFPGYSVHISKKGLDFGSSAGGRAIVTTLQTTKIPPFSIFSEDVAKLDVGNISFTQFNGERWFYALQSPDLITYGLTDADLELKGTFLGLIHMIIVPDFNVGGNLKVTASNVDLSIQIEIQVDSKGRPILDAVDCKANMQNFDLQLSGSAFAWILDMFHKLISQSIQPKIGAAICGAAKKAINTQLKDTIQKLPSPVPVYKDLTFDYHLQNVSVSSAGGIDLSGLGVVDSNGTSGGGNHNPLNVNTKNMTDRMGYVYLSDNILQSASNAAQTSKIFEIEINEKTLPSAKKFLKTNCPGSLCLGSLIKELATDYPNDTCGVFLFTTTAPNITFSDKGIVISVKDLRMNLGIYRDSGTDNFAGASIDFATELVPQISSLKINGTISITELNIQQQFSTLRDKINWVFIQNYGKYLLGKELSTMLGKGYKIPPLQGVTFPNPGLVLRSHTMELSTDIAYKPAAASTKIL